MKYNKEIRELLHKFALDQCNAEELGKLVAYFKKASSSVDLPEVEDLLTKLQRAKSLDKESANQIFDDIMAKTKYSGKNKNTWNINRKSFYKYASAASIILGFIAISYFYHSHNNLQKEENINATTGTFQPQLYKSEKVTLQHQNGEIEVILEDGDSEVLDSNGNRVGKQNGNQLIYQSNAASNELTYNTLIVPFGKRFELVLSDGTKTYLNAGTTIKYPIHFLNGQERKVFVKGEAFFDVARDEKHPFVINTDNLNIRVLGTKFNVSNYPEDMATDVVLVEGSVGLQDATTQNDTKPFLLEPGQMGSFDKKDRKLASKSVSTSIYTSWIEGELVFIDMSFENILKKMERSYNVNIENQNQDIAEEKFNARFRNASLETILAYFKTTYGLEYQVQGKNVIIY